MHFQTHLPWHASRQLTDNLSVKQHPSTSYEKQQVADSSLDSHISDAKNTSPFQAYLRLWRYASPLDWFLRIIGIFAALGGGTAYPLMTIVFGNLVNDFNAIALSFESPAKFRKSVNHNSLWFVYLFIGKFALIYLADFVFCFTATRMSRRIRLQYLREVINQPISYFDKHTPGSIAASLSTDTNIIEVGLADKVATVFQGAGMIIGAFAIAFTKNWKMTLVVGTGLPYIIITTMILGSIVSFLRAKQREMYSEASKISEEALSSVSTITALGANDKIVDSFSIPLNAARRLIIGIGPAEASMFGNIFFSMQSTYALALFYGNRLLSKGEIKDGGTVMVVLFCMMLGSSAMALSSPAIPAFLKAAASAQQVLQIIDQKEPPKTSATAILVSLEGGSIIGNLSLKGVTFCYPERPTTVVLDDLSLELQANKTTAIVGPSGSGKSTIVGLIERWYRPTEGSISLDGVNLDCLNTAELRDQIGLVQQDPMLFNDTIFENVLNGYHGGMVDKLSEKQKRHLVTDACRQANAHDFIEKLPNGYETQVGERSGLLSGGQKQRIALARSLISNPKILLLDEATSALDAESETLVQAALEKSSRGRTTLVVAHKLSTIEHADRIVVMENGQIVEQGTHATLLQANAVYCRLLQAQTITAPEGVSSITIEQKTKPGVVSVTTSHAKPTELHSPDHTIISLDSDLISRRLSMFKCILSILRDTKSVVPAFLGGTIGACIASAAMPMQAFLFSRLVTVFQFDDPQRTNRANFWASMFFALALTNVVSYAILWFLFALAASKISMKYRARYLKDLLSQDMSWFEVTGNSSGALNALLSMDGDDLDAFFGMSIALLMVFIVGTPACGLLAIGIGWRLGLVGVFGCFPVLFLAGFLRMRMDKGSQDRCAASFVESSRFASEAVEAIKTVASLSLEEKVLQRYEGRLKNAVLSTTKRMSVSTVLFAMSDCLDLLALALVFWYGGQLVSRAQMEVQPFFLAYMAIMFGGQGAGFIFGYSSSVTKAQAAINRMLYMSSRGAASKSGGDAHGAEQAAPQLLSKSVISFENVDFHYPTRSEVTVLKGLSFDVMKGESVSIVGPSGSGKSTIISLLERFYEPTTGSILVNGRSIHDQDIETYRDSLSLVSQETLLYQGSIRANLLLGLRGKEIEEDRLEKACKEANIHDFIISLPEGYNTDIGPRGVSLSGGQRQRITIARALLRNPEILLLDEATSALDPKSQGFVMEALEKVGKGRTTISVTHHLEMIKRADKVLVVENGQVVESGTFEELIALKGRFFGMVGELVGQE